MLSFANTSDQKVGAMIFDSKIKIVAIVITKLQLRSFMAVLIFCDTPKKGQIPRNCDKTMLFTKTEP
jgi:hypothetical protein